MGLLGSEWQKPKDAAKIQEFKGLLKTRSRNSKNRFGAQERVKHYF